MPETSRIMAEQMQAPNSVFVITENVTQLLPTGHRIGKVSSHRLRVTCN